MSTCLLRPIIHARSTKAAHPQFLRSPTLRVSLTTPSVFRWYLSSTRVSLLLTKLHYFSFLKFISLPFIYICIPQTIALCVNIRGQLASSPLVPCGNLGIESRLSGLLSHLACLARYRTLFCNISFPELNPQCQNMCGFHYLVFPRVLPPHCSIQQLMSYE